MVVPFLLRVRNACFHFHTVAWILQNVQTILMKPLYFLTSGVARILPLQILSDGVCAGKNVHILLVSHFLVMLFAVSYIVYLKSATAKNINEIWLQHIIDNELQHITVDCEWGPWANGTCSVFCGGGIQTKTRNKTVEEKYGGECIGDSTMTDVCNEDVKCRMFFNLIEFDIHILCTIFNQLTRHPKIQQQTCRPPWRPAALRPPIPSDRIPTNLSKKREAENILHSVPQST